MKTVIVALLVVLVVGHSEALQCYCGGNRRCPSPIETCSGSDQVCASIVLHAGSQPTSFRSCYDAYDCARLTVNSPVSYGRCCRTNLCN